MMKYLTLPFQSEKVEKRDLQLSKAIELAGAISNSPYSNLEECRRCANGDEILIFETQPQIGNQPKNDIRYVEKLSVRFDNSDNVAPEVLALRDDFPQVSHLNLMPFEKPKSLCLYERPYEELKFNWRGVLFLERIREWLALTALGELHQDDQPLEPFFLSLAGTMIITEPITIGRPLHIYQLGDSGSISSLVASPAKLEGLDGYEFNAIPIVVNLPPQHHGIIRRSPSNLADLDEQFSVGAFELIETEIKKAISGYLQKPELHGKKLVILAILPKTRTDSGPTETADTYAFLTIMSVKDVALSINLWSQAAGMIAETFPVTRYDKSEAAKIEIGALSVLSPFTKSFARVISSTSERTGSLRIAQIGAGALGSQIFLNLCRMGIGEWVLLDDDYLYPHNLAKHALTKESLGFSKSDSMATVANSLLSTNQAESLHENFLKPINESQLNDKLKSVDLILDVSASVPVARKLAAAEYQARKVSAYLNPIGTDVVILAEGSSNKVSLDVLEMQYYRYLLSTPELVQHLNSDANPVRYSSACRNLTSKITQDNVGTLSGIASKAIRKTIEADANEIKIWKLNDDGSVRLFAPTIYPTAEFPVNSWTVKTDRYVLQTLHDHRAKRLPNETGGILIGSYDLARRIIYIVDTILSPKDSGEYPTAYYRGLENVTSRLKQIDATTAGNLTYIGEWHSHPKGCSLGMSDKDKILFDWIEDYMTKIGLPPLMVICGGKQVAIYTQKSK